MGDFIDLLRQLTWPDFEDRDLRIQVAFEAIEEIERLREENKSLRKIVGRYEADARLRGMGLILPEHDEVEKLLASQAVELKNQLNEARSQCAALRKALRLRAINGLYRTGKFCLLCLGAWSTDEPERHAPDCLAREEE